MFERLDMIEWWAEKPICFLNRSTGKLNLVAHDNMLKTRQILTRVTRQLIAWAPAIGWAMVLFLLSSLSDSDLSSFAFSFSFPFDDKVMHLALYSVLGGTLQFGRLSSNSGLAHWTVIAIGIIYGVSDEWHQSFVPGRNPSAADLLADAMGVLMGYAFTYWLLPKLDLEVLGYRKY